MLYDTMLQESKKLSTQLEEIDSQLEHLPDGKLICTKNEGKYKWYQSDGHISVYIPKHNRQLAEQLAYKKYLNLHRQTILKEKKAVESYLKYSLDKTRQAEIDFATSPRYQELLSAMHTPLSEELQNWMNDSYEKQRKFQEGLIHTTYSGNLVRSKSEAMIDMFLCKYQVPFRYECALKLGEIVIYPDFTIRHPETGEMFYWEHFGLMDNPEYKKNMISKLQLYTSHGIIPSIQLITTYETRETPLNMDMIEKIVRHYFCR